MEIETLHSWVAQLNTPSLYNEFEAEDESTRAKRTVVLSKNLKRTKEENIELYDNLNWLILKSKDGSVASKTIIIYAFYPFLIKYATLYYRKFCIQDSERIFVGDVIQDAFEKLLILRKING